MHESYGIRFNSNFQWSTTSRDVKDGKAEHISREPEQVKAFRDTWRDGIHSYLTYLRDRLTVARELLTESGSIFVQIGDENVHSVRALMDEVFGRDAFVSCITFTKTEGLSDTSFSNVTDYILWYTRNNSLKYRDLLRKKRPGEPGATGFILLEDKEKTHWRSASREEIKEGQVPGYRFFDDQPLVSQDSADDDGYVFRGRKYSPPTGRHWSTGRDTKKLRTLDRANRLIGRGNRIEWKRYIDETAGTPLNNVWIGMGERGFAGSAKVYVVQTATEVIERCVLMSTDPGDLVLDPTCGSGTTAYVAEQWGRRWITIDTSRVALALARARIMGARYPWYLLADSREGQRKEAEIARRAPSEAPTHGDIRQGFVYERVPHVTLKSIANNAEIDVVWERCQETLEPLRAELNAALDRTWEEWEIPREAGEPWPASAADAWKAFQETDTDGKRRRALRIINTELDRAYTLDDLPDAPRDPWPADVTEVHRLWWEARIARQQEIDASIAARAEVEYLCDKPYEDRKKVRVAGPFTVESLSPHRVLAINERDELIDRVADRAPAYGTAEDFAAMVLGHLATAGVQQAHKADRITFSSVDPWPGDRICAQGRYTEGEEGAERRAGILVGPEFGTVARQELVRGAREAAEAGFDVLVACAFNFEPHATEFNKLGALPVLKARMNADLHMADDLANTGKGNLFVIFGEPDIEILPADGEDAETGRVQVKIHGVDVFHPSTGEVRSDGADDIACWFIDTDYNDESFFVRQAYFLGANDPYKALRTTLKAEIDAAAWATLHSDTSRAFERPRNKRIAVKVINHLGDEVMKVFQT